MIWRPNLSLYLKYNEAALKRAVLFTIIVILYLLTPVCITSALGTMVSKKYEVDESYWRIDGNNNLTAEQKVEQVNSLDRKGKLLEYKAYAFAFFSFIAFISATGLLIKKNKIAPKHDKQHITRAL